MCTRAQTITSQQNMHDFVLVDEMSILSNLPGKSHQPPHISQWLQQRGTENVVTIDISQYFDENL
eukprot:TRINITY_DN2358_c0_g1_i1.p4 TRINITY_DN2358_c0_g1~~TRINITY_DN2358_c0_g1_i1.p4  ORF type:complete len:65 (-),score=8.81 TRINITY_DN2358_c0_g1_i1:1432-1626(-)